MELCDLGNSIGQTFTFHSWTPNCYLYQLLCMFHVLLFIPCRLKSFSFFYVLLGENRKTYKHTLSRLFLGKFIFILCFRQAKESICCEWLWWHHRRSRWGLQVGGKTFLLPKRLTWRRDSLLFSCLLVLRHILLDCTEDNLAENALISSCDQLSA